MSNRQDDALLYPEQDHMALGDFYLRHVSAMTGEGLHAKSDIAAQLAWRDQTIASLQARLDAAERIVRSAHQELAPGGLYAGLQRDADRFLSGDF